MKNSAFTLLEMTVVMAIIAILSLLAVPRFENIMIKNEQRRFIAELALGHMAWRKIEGGMSTAAKDSINTQFLLPYWPFIENVPQGVSVGLDPKVKTLTIYDTRNSSQSYRCHRFTMNPYGVTEIYSRHSQLTTDSCP